MKRIDVQRKKSESIAEFLKNEENQSIVLEKIKEALRVRGEWGRHGLFTALGKRLGFSSAYMGRVLTGRDPLREKSVQKMAEYLGVSVAWLCGNCERSYQEEVLFWKETEIHYADEMADYSAKDQWDRAVIASAKMIKYRPLVDEFMRISEDSRQEAVEVLAAIEWLRTTPDPYSKRFTDNVAAAKITPPPAEEE